MKLFKRILALVISMSVAVTMISTTYASAYSIRYEAPSISTAPEFRKNGIDLKANEVYSTLKDLPTEPTVGISVQMGSSYNYRDSFSIPNLEYTSSTYLPSGDRFSLTIKSSAWSAFFVHAAQVAYTADGVKLVNKNGTVASTIAVAQPDFNNVELVDATITGAGTYKAAIVGHDFQNDGSIPGFNWLMLTSNVGYNDGLVSNQKYTVYAYDLNATIREADRLLATLKANLMYLTAVNADLEARKLEIYITNLESAISKAESAAKNVGKTLSTDYHLEISSMKVNGYNSARSYSAGIPDMTYNVPNVVTDVNLAEDSYNFSEYNIVNVYRWNTDAIGASVNASSSGAIIALPTYALEVEFTIDEGDADVFGYQGDINKANNALKATVEKASKFNYELLDKIGTVSGFKTSSVSSSAVKLTWNKVSGAQGYIVYKYDNAKKTWVRVAKTKTTANTYTVSKLASGTSYKFAVKAYKTVNGKEVTSSSFPTVTAITKLPAVVNGATTIGKNSVKLTWKKTTGAQGYIIYKYNPSTKTWARLAKTKSLNYLVKRLKSNSNYNFAVKAYKNVSGKEITSVSFKTISVKTKK